MPVGFAMSPEYSETSPLMSIRNSVTGNSSPRDPERVTKSAPSSGIECGIRNRMKIAGEFSRDCQICGFTEFVATPQPDLDSAACRFRNDRQHAPWAKRDDLRRCVANEDGTLARDRWYRNQCSRSRSRRRLSRKADRYSQFSQQYS